MNRVFVDPQPQQFKAGGSVNSNGKLYFYEPGATTTTLKPIYSDPLLTVQLNNPVLLDDDGRFPAIYMQESDYAVRLTDYADVQIWRVNNYQPPTLASQFAAWDSSVTYAVDDFVKYTDGKYYVSTQSGNVGRPPNTSPTHWKETYFLTVWNSSQAYALEEVVIHDGIIYTCYTANTAIEPGTDATYWRTFGEVPPKSNVVSTSFTYYRDDNDASKNSSDITSLVAASTFLSVGPTGSGASYVWSDLDAVPTTAKTVMLSVQVQSTKNSGSDAQFSISSDLRKNGGAALFPGPAPRGFGGGTVEDRAAGQCTVTVPVDSNRVFEVRYNALGSPDLTTMTLFYLGYQE